MHTWFVKASIALITVVWAVTSMMHMFIFNDKNVFFYYARSWSRLLLRLARIRVEVHGVEFLKSTERYIYVSNHASLFDIPVILAFIPDNVRIMYKKELGRIPVFGWCLRMSPFISIDRSRGKDAAAALDQTVNTFATGSSVAIFPEGTRSADGRLGAFKRGAFILAARSQRPLVPVALVGTTMILPARSNRFQPGVVQCIIHRPITIPANASRQDEAQMMADVHQEIATHLTFAA